MLKPLREDKHLSVSDLNDESIFIFRKSKKRYRRWKKQIMEQYSDKIAGVFEISKQQRKVVLTMSFYDLEELVEINPKPGSYYISSASEPSNEEMEIDFERLVNWLSHYGLPQ